jgi:tetratricopeptide (TPR) repeat protein
LDPSQPPEVQVKQLESQLVTVNDQYGQRMPLLSVVLGLPIADTALTGSLADPKLAKSLRESLIVDWLRARSRSQPILLVLEDIHWIDPLSHDLAEAVGRAIIDLPVLLLAAYRPPELERIKAARVMSLPYATEIRLQDFTTADAERLIELKLERLFGKRVEADHTLTVRLLERAGGNPFYLDELINLMHDRGFDINRWQALEGLEWPDNLQSLILSRLDQLDEGDKTTLKVASVVGNTFKADWLWAIYPRLGDRAQVERQLNSLEQLHFTRLEKTEPELEYLFRHIMTREVTYESLAFATRAELHGLVAAFLERRYAGQLEPYLDLLAYHYSHTPRLDKQREYYRRAGEVAQLAYANEAALEYYRRLLNLLEKPEEKLSILLEIALIERMTGAWESASKRLEQALAISRQLQDKTGMARCFRFLGLNQADRSDYEAAIQSFRKSQLLFRELDDRRGIAEVLADLAVIARNQGDYEASNGYSRESLALYRELDDKPGITLILNNMGLVADNLGDQAAARRYLEESMAVARQSGNKIVLGEALNSLGIFAFYQGDYEADLRYVQESLALFQEVGYKHKMATSLSNLASPAFERGDYKTAQGYWLKGLALFRELGDKRMVARMLNNLAKASERQGDYQTPQNYYRESLALRREVGDKEGVAQSVNNLGMLARLLGDYPTARRYLQEGLGLAREIGHKGQQILALHNLSYLALLEGDTRETERLITQSLAIAVEMGSKSWMIDNLSLLVCSLAAQPERARLAARLAGVIEELVTLTGYQREPYMCRLYEEKLAGLRATLGPAQFGEAVTLGHSTNLNDALQEVSGIGCQANIEN